MSNIGIALTIIGIITMVGAYFLYKNTPKKANITMHNTPNKSFWLTANVLAEFKRYAIQYL